MNHILIRDVAMPNFSPKVVQTPKACISIKCLSCFMVSTIGYVISLASYIKHDENQEKRLAIDFVERKSKKSFQPISKTHHC